MEIVKLKLEDLRPYKGNAKIHTEEQIEQIKKSIETFGMNDPIAVWGEDNVIVEGHGRVQALKEMGVEEVDAIRLDHLTDEERKAYTLAHNKINMNTGFDLDMLDLELDDIQTINMEDFGFVYSNIDWDTVEELNETTYEEPTHKMLECPKCHHIDRDIHFKKVDATDSEAEEHNESEVEI